MPKVFRVFPEEIAGGVGGRGDLFQFELFFQGLPNLVDGISLELVETAHNALVILPSLLDLLFHHWLGYLGGAIQMQ